MWIILIEILLSATAGLLWCVLVMFFCMCMEHTFFKRPARMELTQKEIILIREVLAGHISLPLVANDGLFVECVDRIERIFDIFIRRTEVQTKRMDALSDKLSRQQLNAELSNNEPPQPIEIDIFEELKSDKRKSVDELLEIYLAKDKDNKENQ